MRLSPYAASIVSRFDLDLDLSAVSFEGLTDSWKSFVITEASPLLYSEVFASCDARPLLKSEVLQFSEVTCFDMRATEWSKLGSMLQACA